jgi:hypothetical protein
MWSLLATSGHFWPQRVVNQQRTFCKDPRGCTLEHWTNLCTLQDASRSITLSKLQRMSLLCMVHLPQPSFHLPRISLKVHMFSGSFSQLEGSWLEYSADSSQRTWQAKEMF